MSPCVSVTLNTMAPLHKRFYAGWALKAIENGGYFHVWIRDDSEDANELTWWMDAVKVNPKCISGLLQVKCDAFSVRKAEWAGLHRLSSFLDELAELEKVRDPAVARRLGSIRIRVERRIRYECARQYGGVIEDI